MPPFPSAPHPHVTAIVDKTLPMRIKVDAVIDEFAELHQEIVSGFRAELQDIGRDPAPRAERARQEIDTRRRAAIEQYAMLRTGMIEMRSFIDQKRLFDLRIPLILSEVEHPQKCAQTIQALIELGAKRQCLYWTWTKKLRANI